MTQEQQAEAAPRDPLRVLEAILFASSQPLTTGAIRARMPEGADVGGLLMELQQAYEGRGVSLVDLDGSWVFRTASDLGPALEVTRDVSRRLSRAAMETLAIIAYHQPVTRAEIENIRGVATHRGMIDILMECGWIRPGPRREAPGRPVTWVTTPAFLDQFGLQALTDLPGLEELKASGLLDRRPALEALSPNGDLFDRMEAEDALESEEDESDEDEYEKGGSPRLADEDSSGEDSEEEDSDEETDEDDDDDDYEDDEEDE